MPPNTNDRSATVGSEAILRKTLHLRTYKSRGMVDAVAEAAGSDEMKRQRPMQTDTEADRRQKDDPCGREI